MKNQLLIDNEVTCREKHLPKEQPGARQHEECANNARHDAGSFPLHSTAPVRTPLKFCTGAGSEYFRTMYSKQEVSKLKENFWTAFGKYMKPVLSADGEPISWLNYKTGIPGVFFKMDADSQQASVAIVITQTGSRFYQQFADNKAFLEATLGENWVWEADTTDEYGKTMSTISTRIQGVNILQSQDWPAIISFFKPRIIALDEFWSMAKYGFEALL